MFGKKSSNEEKEAMLDDIMLSGQMPIESSDQARAQAIAKLSEDNDILSDLKDMHINIITGMDTIDNWLKKNGVHSVITQSVNKEFKRLRISRERKSRQEITDVVKIQEGAGWGSKLKKRLGF